MAFLAEKRIGSMNGSEKKVYVTYMVRCRDNSLYTGFTVGDVNRRVAVHNEGRGAKYTRSRLPVTLVWYHEWDNEHDARSMEVKLKRKTKAEKEVLVKGE